MPVWGREGSFAPETIWKLSSPPPLHPGCSSGETLPRELEVENRKAQLGRHLLQAGSLRAGEDPSKNCGFCSGSQGLLFAIPENLSRYAQQMSLGRWPHTLFIRLCRTNVGGGQKNLQGQALGGWSEVSQREWQH